jgi:hypothetical protein
LPHQARQPSHGALAHEVADHQADIDTLRRASARKMPAQEGRKPGWTNEGARQRWGNITWRSEGLGSRHRGGFQPRWRLGHRVGIGQIRSNPPEHLLLWQRIRRQHWLGGWRWCGFINDLRTMRGRWNAPDCPGLDNVLLRIALGYEADGERCRLPSRGWNGMQDMQQVSQVDSASCHVCDY